MSFYSSGDIKNEILEPSVHNQNNRTEFRIHGSVLPSLKLLNAGRFNTAGAQNLNDMIGQLGCIKNIFIFDGRTELSAVRNFNDVMAFKNLTYSNNQNSDIDRFLKRHKLGYQSRYEDLNARYRRKNMIKNPQPNQSGAADSENNVDRVYFDLREAFNMLQKVPVLSDKVFKQLRLVIEYEPDTTNGRAKCQVPTNVAGANCRPLLAIDRIMDDVKAMSLINTISSVSFTQEEHDQVQVAATGGANSQAIARKLLNFQNKTLGRFRVRKNYQDSSKYISANAVVGFGAYGSANGNAESFQLNVNGRPLFVKGGVKGENRRLALLVDTVADINITESHPYHLVAAHADSVDDANKEGEVDFFGCAINEKIGELQLEYSRTGIADTNNPSQYNDALSLLCSAEVSKVLQVGNGGYTINYV